MSSQLLLLWKNLIALVGEISSHFLWFLSARNLYLRTKSRMLDTRYVTKLNSIIIMFKSPANWCNPGAIHIRNSQPEIHKTINYMFEHILKLNIYLYKTCFMFACAFACAHRGDAWIMSIYINTSGSEAILWEKYHMIISSILVGYGAIDRN